MRRKTVYPAHPVSGDVAGNIARVKQIMRKMNIEDNVQAVAPYVPDCDGVLDDTVLAEREMGIGNDVEHFLRGMIDEVWLFGPKITTGMRHEILLAWDLGIPVVAKTEMTAKELKGMEHEMPNRSDLDDVLVRLVRRLERIGRHDLEDRAFAISGKYTLRLIGELVGRGVFLCDPKGYISIAQ